MSGWRAALRIARREAKRAKARSALIIAMIALPVTALSFAAVLYDTFEPTPTDNVRRELGAAQASLVWQTETPITQGSYPFHTYVATRPGEKIARTDEQLLAQLPPGTTVIRDQTDSLNVHTATGTATIRHRALDYGNPLVEGILRPLEGRAPATDDEVALNPAARDRLGTGIGGTVRPADGTKAFRVTGITENPRNLDTPVIVTKSAAPSPDAIWLTDAALSSDHVAALNAKGISVLTRSAMFQPPPGGSFSKASEIAVGVLIAGVAVLQIVLLAGSALAVGARRRSRDMALVAAVGGTPQHIRRIVLADGIVHGVVAAVLGVVLGVGTAAALLSVLENALFNQRAETLRVWPAALLAIAGCAVLAGLLAAIVPAWISSRQDVVAALSGRRGITRTRRRWPITGLLLAALGVGLCTVGAHQVDLTLILFGLVVATAGMIICTPAVVGVVAMASRWLPVTARIVLRDTARNRTSAAPAISAVMAAVIGTLAIGVITGSEKAYEQTLSSMAPGDVFLSPIGSDGVVDETAVATMQSMLPVNKEYEVDEPTCGPACFVYPKQTPEQVCPYGQNSSIVPEHEQRAALADPRCVNTRRHATYFGLRSGGNQVYVVQPDAVQAVWGIPAGDVPAASAALRAGKVVADDPTLVADGRIRLGFAGPDSHEKEVVAAAFTTPNPGRVPFVLMTQQTATSLGLQTRQLGVLATTTRMPTDEEADRLRAALGQTIQPYVQKNSAPNTTMTLLAIVAGVITIGASAIATGLAAADRRTDVNTLAAVGASPGVRRKLALSQSGLIAGLGSVLGAILGVGAAVAVLSAYNQGLASTWPTPEPYPIVVPWVNVIIAVLAVPVIAMLGAGLFTRSRLPIERRL
ncbi:FtsX-like permease family protein [Kibdelosporangium aridum]|uniref:FtsX-like permease family protein n=1 Tax=Kibdelosporangium aridum TaxID=2030 RepID=UPI000524D6A9